MPFKPLNENASRETFDNASRIDLSIDQTIEDGLIKLRGAPEVTVDPDLNWQDATWSETSAFRRTPSRAAPGAQWDHKTDVPELTSDLAAGQFPFSETPLRRVPYVTEEQAAPFGGGAEARRNLRLRDPYILEDGQTEHTAGRSGTAGRKLRGRRLIDNYGASVLKLEAELGQVNYIQQNTSEAQSYWPDTVNNSVGWTVEFRAHVPDVGTSQLIFDDGDVRVGLKLDTAGIYLETSTNGGGERALLVPWANEFKKVRVAAQGDNIFILSEDGQAYVGTSALTGTPSVAKDLKVGFLGNTEGSILLDYMHQAHDGIYLDVEDDINYVVPVTEAVSTTDSLKHARRVAGYRSAVIKSVAPYTGGTTKVRTQYRNTSNPSWTNLGAYVTISNPQQELNLTSIPVDSDGSDEVRFLISQQANSASTRPAPISEITVLTEFDNVPEFECIPDHGNSTGGNTVVLRALNGNTFPNPVDLYVYDTLVDQNKLTYVSSTEISVEDWPAGDPGDATVYVDTGAPDFFYAERPYVYVASYDRMVDRAHQISLFGGTRSPFRIKDEVPNGEVNLAYISTPGVESDLLVGTIDLSYVESSNTVGGSGQPEVLNGSNITVPGSTFTYQNAPSTEEIAISFGAAGWRGMGSPAPLYYYHIIGKGKYYVYKEQEELDLLDIRSSITVHYQDGTPVDVNDYPWDIVVSTQAFDGSVLPANTYVVALLTNRKYIPGQSVFVTATVVDPSNKMAMVQGYTEVVNTQPLFVLDDDSNMSFDVDISPTGDFTLNIRAK